MSDTAFQTQYRQEFIVGFEQHEALLRQTVVMEAVIKGNQAVFEVADSGAAVAVTRGVNGLIPARSDDLAQNTAVLSEWHDLVRKTGFNIFASQSDQRAIMQMTSRGVLNRKIDNQIVTALNTGTVAIGVAAQAPTISLMENAKVKLQNAFVPNDQWITMAAQPSFMAYLEQAPEFSNALWVDVKPFEAKDGNSGDWGWRDQPVMYRWKGMLVITHPLLPGKGTTSEHSFVYHRNSIGHAVDTAGLTAMVGNNEEQNYAWARTSCFMGAVVLQNSGIVNITADGSAYA